MKYKSILTFQSLLELGIAGKGLYGPTTTALLSRALVTVKVPPGKTEIRYQWPLSMFCKGGGMGRRGGGEQAEGRGFHFAVLELCNISKYFHKRLIFPA